MTIDHCTQILSSGWLLWWMISAASERFLCLQLLPTPLPDTPTLGKTQSTNTSSRTTTSTNDDIHTPKTNWFLVDSLQKIGLKIIYITPKSHPSLTTIAMLLASSLFSENLLGVKILWPLSVVVHSDMLWSLVMSQAYLFLSLSIFLHFTPSLVRYRK